MFAPVLAKHASASDIATRRMANKTKASTRVYEYIAAKIQTKTTRSGRDFKDEDSSFNHPTFNIVACQ